MLISGKYRAEKDGVFGYKIIISVKETDKSYIFNLIKYDSRYSPAQMDMLFAKSNKLIINKKSSPHAMRVWSDKDFTIYPFQAGVPFYFKFINDKV